MNLRTQDINYKISQKGNPFLTCFTIDLLRFEIHFGFSVWGLRRDSILAAFKQIRSRFGGGGKWIPGGSIADFGNAGKVIPPKEVVASSPLFASGQQQNG